MGTINIYKEIMKKRVRLTEKDLHMMVKKIINETLNEGVAPANGNNLVERWDELIECLGPEGMLNAIFQYLPETELGEMIDTLWTENDLDYGFEEDEY